MKPSSRAPSRIAARAPPRRVQILSPTSAGDVAEEHGLVGAADVRAAVISVSDSRLKVLAVKVDGLRGERLRLLHAQPDDRQRAKAQVPPRLASVTPRRQQVHERGERDGVDDAVARDPLLGCAHAAYGLPRSPCPTRARELAAVLVVGTAPAPDPVTRSPCVSMRVTSVWSASRWRGSPS